jgi:hypothetical protein
MPGTIARLHGARSRKIARPLWVVSVAVAIATLNAPAVFAGSGQGAVADSVAVSVPASTVRVASAGTTGAAETRVADFRYGAPRMGSTPRLPIPPPHRMRSGSANPRI